MIGGFGWSITNVVEGTTTNLGESLVRIGVDVFTFYQLLPPIIMQLRAQFYQTHKGCLGRLTQENQIPRQLTLSPTKRRYG